MLEYMTQEKKNTCIIDDPEPCTFNCFLDGEYISFWNTNAQRILLNSMLISINM